jgi:O-antigen/teichoic acid export membrane protein
MVLYVLEKTHVNLLVYVLLAIINVGLDLVLIPKYGVPGAMIPVAIAIAAQPVVYFLAVRRLVPDVSIPFRFIGRCFFASSAVLVGCPCSGASVEAWAWPPRRRRRRRRWRRPIARRVCSAPRSST